MSQINQNFTIVCESAVIDKFTNKLYLLGIFDNINTKGVPAAHPAFSVVTNFGGGEGTHSHKIIIKFEDGTEIGKLEGNINFESGKNAQYIGRFWGLVFPKVGAYLIYVYVDGVEQPIKAKINVVQQQ